MSLAEVISEVESWTPDQREELALHLSLLRSLNDPAHIEELSRRLDRMQAGEFVTREALQAQLAARGIPLA